MITRIETARMIRSPGLKDAKDNVFTSPAFAFELVPELACVRIRSTVTNITHLIPLAGVDVMVEAPDPAPETTKPRGKK